MTPLDEIDAEIAFYRAAIVALERLRDRIGRSAGSEGTAPGKPVRPSVRAQAEGGNERRLRLARLLATGPRTTNQIRAELGLTKHQAYRALMHIWFTRTQGLCWLSDEAPAELRSATRPGSGAASPST